MKRVIIFLVVIGLSTEAGATPFESIGAFVLKLFKGGDVAKEAVVVGRSTEAGSVANGLEHLPSTQAIVEPKPNTVLEPIAKNRKDADTYKELRGEAERGDVSAMLKMSDMTLKNKVSDPGEPYYAYWLLQAARGGSQFAMEKLKSECSRSADKRKADYWFDLGCRKNDGRTLYVGENISGMVSRYHTKPDMQSR